MMITDKLPQHKAERIIRKADDDTLLFLAETHISKKVRNMAIAAIRDENRLYDYICKNIEKFTLHSSAIYAATRLSTEKVSLCAEITENDFLHYLSQKKQKKGFSKPIIIKPLSLLEKLILRPLNISEANENRIMLYIVKHNNYDKILSIIHACPSFEIYSDGIGFLHLEQDYMLFLLSICEYSIERDELKYHVFDKRIFEELTKW